jgi:hypothetical protein
MAKTTIAMAKSTKTTRIKASPVVQAQEPAKPPERMSVHLMEVWSYAMHHPANPPLKCATEKTTIAMDKSTRT